METNYQAARFIPEGSVAIEREDLKAVVYVYASNHNGMLAARGFSGRRTKPDFRYNFPCEESRKNFIQKYFNRLAERIASKLKWREEEKKRKAEFLKSLSAGTILYSSWGYDQTNITFYEVSRVKGSTVHLRKMESQMVPSEGFGSMAGKTIPVSPAQYRGEEFKKIVRGGGINMSSYESLRPWDGTPQYCSWGH